MIYRGNYKYIMNNTRTLHVVKKQAIFIKIRDWSYSILIRRRKTFKLRHKVSLNPNFENLRQHNLPEITNPLTSGSVFLFR